MCKKRIVLVTFCVAVLFSGAAMAEVDDSGRLIVLETSVAPFIDGELDDVWQNVSEEGVLITEIINATSAVPEDSNDLSATFQVMYDDDNFYMYVVVRDSVLDYEFSDWNGDGVEIFFDGDNNKGSSYDGVNDNQIRITVDDVELANIDSTLPVDGSAFKVMLTDVGYNIEASFPLATLQIVPENTFGFEVQINDNDGGGGRETMIRWFSNDNNSWRDASLFGEAILVPEPEPVDPGSDGLVAYYAFENNTDDNSVNELHGTLVGDPNFVEGLPGYGMALDFDGINDVVELGKFDVFGQITLAAWIRPDSFTINDGRIISKAKEWGSNDHWWMLSTVASGGNYVPRFRLKTDESDTVPTLIAADGILTAGAWSHVTATWDGTSMIVYVDAVEAGRVDKGGTAVAVDPNVSVAIGSQPSDAFATDPSRVVKFFDGLIDEVGIYHRSLSAGEIRYLAGYRAPVDPGIENLAAFYPLDNDANDASGNNNHGMPSGDPQWVAGMIGAALQFDGVDDYVDCGNGPSLDITGPITIVAWFYPTGAGSSTLPRIVDKSNGTGGADPGYKLYLRAAQNYIFAFGAGGVYQPYSTLAADLNAWNYVAVTTDGTHRRLFLNGAWEEWEESALPVSSSNPLYIGNSPAGARHFQGMIDEVVIYNRALSKHEVHFLAGER